VHVDGDGAPRRTFEREGVVEILRRHGIDGEGVELAQIGAVGVGLRLGLGRRRRLGQHLGTETSLDQIVDEQGVEDVLQRVALAQGPHDLSLETVREGEQHQIARLGPDGAALHRQRRTGLEQRFDFQALAATDDDSRDVGRPSRGIAGRDETGPSQLGPALVGAATP